MASKTCSCRLEGFGAGLEACSCSELPYGSLGVVGDRVSAQNVCCRHIDQPAPFQGLSQGDTFTVHGMTCDVIQLDHIEHPSRPRVAITYRDSDTGRYFDRVYAAELPVG